MTQLTKKDILEDLACLTTFRSKSIYLNKQLETFKEVESTQYILHEVFAEIYLTEDRINLARDHYMLANLEGETLRSKLEPIAKKCEQTALEVKDSASANSWIDDAIKTYDAAGLFEKAKEIKLNRLDLSLQRNFRNPQDLNFAVDRYIANDCEKPQASKRVLEQILIGFNFSESLNSGSCGRGRRDIANFFNSLEQKRSDIYKDVLAQCQEKLVDECIELNKLTVAKESLENSVESYEHLWKKIGKKATSTDDFKMQIIAYTRANMPEETKESWFKFAQSVVLENEELAIYAYQKAGVDVNDVDELFFDTYINPPWNGSGIIELIENSKTYFDKANFQGDKFKEKIELVKTKLKSLGNSKRIASLYELFGLKEEVKSVYLDIARTGQEYDFETRMDFYQKTDIPQDAVIEEVIQNFQLHSKMVSNVESLGDVTREQWIYLGNRANERDGRYIKEIAIPCFERVNYAQGSLEEKEKLANLYEQTDSIFKAIELRKSMKGDK